MRPSQPSHDVLAGSALDEVGTLDLGAAAHALWRKRAWILVPTLLALGLSTAAVQVIRPSYKATAQVLLQSQELPFTRPTGEQPPQQGDAAIDDSAIGSQVQVMLSRDLAKQAIAQLDLNNNPDFDPMAHTPGLMERLGRQLGFVKDPSGKAHDERVLDSYLEALSVYPLEKSRVIAVEFSARDPDLAARAANTITGLYIEAQQGRKRAASQVAADSLSPQLEQLRHRVAKADAAVESYRAQTGLFVGQNSNSLSSQQLQDINNQLTAARSQQTDSQARAKMIRSLLAANKPVELTDVTNNELVRRLVEQRVNLQAQLAQESRTLLPGHPRIKGLKAQLDGLQEQIQSEALRTARSLENDAALAGSRVDALRGDLESQKALSATSNDKSVELRALELEAKSERDLLESLLTRYREASARASLTDLPADGRVVSNATPPTTPYFPKKGPIILITTLLAFVLSSALVAMLQLLSQPSGSRVAVRQPGDAELDRWREALMPAHTLETARPEMPVAPRHEPVAERPVERPAEPITEHPALEAVALRLRATGEAGHRLVIDTLDGQGSASRAAGRLARALAARHMSVVILDLDSDGVGTGFGEVLAGQAGFTEVIQRRPGSSAHAIALGGLPVLEPAIARQRSAFVLDALASSYDVAIVAAGPGYRAALQPCLDAFVADCDEVLILAGPSVDAEVLAAHRAVLGEAGASVVTSLDLSVAPAEQREAA